MISLRQLLDTNEDGITILGKTSLRHVHQVLRCSPEEKLRIIRESIAYLRLKGTPVWFDAERFFDALLENQDYAISTLLTAQEAVAARIILCDTNGVSLPQQIADGVKIRVINSRGIASRTRVSIGSTDGVHLWKTVGVHNNIMQASLRALVDSVVYAYIVRHNRRNQSSYTEGLDTYSFFSVSSRYFSNFRFTLCRALSIDFTCLPRDSAIS